MSSSICCFLTCIQMSQEADKTVWYSRLFQNFPVCCDALSQRLWHNQWSRNRCFSGTLLLFWWSNGCWPFDLWFLCLFFSFFLLPFLNPAWTSGSSQFMYCWSLAWRILNIASLVCEMSAILRKFEHSLALPVLGIGMKTDLFQSCGHCWVFQICWLLCPLWLSLMTGVVLSSRPFSPVINSDFWTRNTQMLEEAMVFLPNLVLPWLLTC